MSCALCPARRAGTARAPTDPTIGSRETLGAATHVGRGKVRGTFQDSRRRNGDHLQGPPSPARRDPRHQGDAAQRRRGRGVPSPIRRRGENGDTPQASQHLRDLRLRARPRRLLLARHGVHRRRHALGPAQGAARPEPRPGARDRSPGADGPRVSPPEADRPPRRGPGQLDAHGRRGGPIRRQADRPRHRQGPRPGRRRDDLDRPVSSASSAMPRPSSTDRSPRARRSTGAATSIRWGSSSTSS